MPIHDDTTGGDDDDVLSPKWDRRISFTIAGLVVLAILFIFGLAVYRFVEAVRAMP